MKLMIATNPMAGAEMLARRFNPITFASNDMETVAHYYEGCVIEIDVKLETSQRSPYVSCVDDLSKIGLTPETYGYGMKTNMTCPANAKWYSISRDYLSLYLRGIKEINPDLSAFQEADDD